MAARLAAQSAQSTTAGAAPLGEHRIALYIEGDALYAAMLAAIAAARASVRLESYIYASDEIGRRFADALVERARAGCHVTLRFDAFGSLGAVDAGTESALREAGVRVQRSRRWNWRRPFKVHRRNHRKLLVVDDRVAFLGGYNIHRECSRAVYGEARWRDTHARMEGPVAFDAGIAFELYERSHWSVTRRDEVWLLPNRGLRGRWLLHRVLRRRFRAAQQRIWLTTPYFVPDQSTQNQLVRAARRGVDVRVLVPGRSDVALAQWATRAAYTPLLAAGVKLYEYRPRVLHAKTIVVDADWATVGTANVDYRSLFINDELNAVFGPGPVVDELARHFEADCAESAQVRIKPWRRRPWTMLLAESIGWFVRRWL